MYYEFKEARKSFAESNVKNFFSNCEKYGMVSAVIALDTALTNNKNMLHGDAFIKQLKESKIKLTDEIAQILVKHNPEIIEHIKTPSQTISMQAISAMPNVIGLIPQSRFLCKFAISKDITVYPLLKEQFRTYEYLLKYQHRNKELNETLKMIYKTGKVPKKVLVCLDKSLVFGTEIEFTTNKGFVPELKLLLDKVIDIDLLSSGKNDGKKWGLSKDGTNYNTYEIASKKLYVDQIGDMTELHKTCVVLKILEKFSYIQHDAENCGLHIHINVKDLQYDKVITILTNYYYLQPVLNKLFSTTRTFNYFCKPLTNCVIKNEMSNYSELKYTPHESLYSRRSYTVNPYAYFYNDTIEFRQHESIFDFTGIIYWLHIIQSIMVMPKLNDYVFFLDTFYKKAKINKTVREYYNNKYMKKDFPILY